MSQQPSYLTMVDDIKLHFKKDGEKGKLAFVIVHGIAEHLKRYDYFTNKLVEENFSVYRFDLRGHGLSEGKRGDLKRFGDYLSDLDQIINKVKKENPNKKIILFGHSMGGLISTAYASTYTNKIDYLILSGASNKTPISASLLKFLPYLLLSLIKYKNELKKGLTNVEEINNNYFNDPLVLRKLSLRLLGNAFIKGVRVVRKNIKNINVPALILHGEKDPIVKSNTSIWTFKNLNVEDKNLIIYDNLMHEILNEEEKDEVIRDILNWINERL